MTRSSRWILLLTLSTLLALVAPASVPIHAAPARQEAAPSAPRAIGNSEIVLIDSSGRIRVDSRYPGQVTRWTSDDVGWQNIAAGNFDGNSAGYQQIVAVRNNEIRVFEPFRVSSVPMHLYTPNGWFFDLLTVGDFDGDGRKEIAASYYQPYATATNIIIYDYLPGTSTWNSYVQTNSPWAARWQDMQAGNINGDGYQDLVLVRQAGNLLKALLGTGTPGTFAPLPDDVRGAPYLALAVGNTDGAGNDEVVASRYVPSGGTKTVLVFQLIGTGFVDVTPFWTDYTPQFTSLSLADVNNDGRKELLSLRDPLVNKTALQVLNLASSDGVPMFQAAIGCSGGGCDLGPWKTVRGGDLDGDSMDEIVVLRNDRYNIYDDAAHAFAYLGTVLGSFYINPTTANATSLLVTNLDGSGAPILLASPGVLDLGNVPFGMPSPAPTLNIINGGSSSAINWTAQVKGSASTWLHIDRTQGMTPSAVRVWADPVAAGLGSWQGYIGVSTSDANVLNPADVLVKLTVTDPGLLVTPDRVGFYQVTGEPVTSASRTVRIVKPSDGAVGWTAAILPVAAAQEVLAKLADGTAKVTGDGVSVDGQIMAAPTWLTLDNYSGTVGNSATSQPIVPLTISVDQTKVAGPNVYNAVVVVVAQNYVQSVAVSYILSNTAQRLYFPQAAK